MGISYACSDVGRFVGVMSLHRYSFRQLLLVAFLLIAALLSAASLRGLFTLEGLLRQSSAGARQAVAFSAAAQLMAERSVDMERAARQFLVLGDPNLRQRFDDAAREAGASLAQLSAASLPQKTADTWRATLETIEAQLTGTAPSQRLREQALTAAFAELDQLNGTIADQVRQAAEQRNQVLRDELEARRVDLAQQILGAIVVAGVLALVFGLWLARPLKRIENAIVGLGENRL